MNSLINQKNNHNLSQNISQSTNNFSLSSKKTYGNILSTLNKIFSTLGKNHIFNLVKLRKLWCTKIDSFLSKNAYPRNISVIFKFNVDSNFLSEIGKTKLTLDLLKVLEKIKGKSFSRLKQFISYLEKKLGRSITNEEMELLKNKVNFKPIRNILHLTVYDGSISQAIHFEIEAYLRMFNRMLPEIKFDDIHCHVGEIEKIKLDQRYVSYLAKDWHLITSESISRKCMPAFLNRISKKHVILVLYISNHKDLDLLKNNPGVDWLLEHLQKKCFELRGVLKNIKFVHMEGVDLEKIKLTSIILGGDTKKNILSKEKLKTIVPNDVSYKKIIAQEKFSKITRKLRSK